MNYKLVVVVREDLEMSCGKLAAQVAHASSICTINAYRYRRETFDRWWSEGQKKVVLKVKSLDEMLELKKRADEMGIFNSLIQDAGLTELSPGTITVLGIGPEREIIIDKLTGSLPLY
ncbi:MAG: peptidyl-tRNA hydrolase Pth2 [Thermoplasmata archaeon]|jgi:PTH2 family peptidyl-tRNA hydrolase|nr:peptidyl-tRNA hydrolase [Thermoplasmatales archaeon]PMP74104.1 MAG: aminoacyl-tRNA hydrolase [Aciduliprofundum sp.]